MSPIICNSMMEAITIAGLFLIKSRSLRIKATKICCSASAGNLDKLTGLDDPPKLYLCINEESTPCHNQKNKVANWKTLIVNFDNGSEATSNASETKYKVLYPGTHFAVIRCILLKLILRFYGFRLNISFGTGSIKN